MFDSSRRTLILLAAILWYSGAIILSYKSSRLLLEAQSINSNLSWIWLSVLAGIMIGAVKAKYLFKPLCLKNLQRIETLKTPMFWQFYRTRFYFFLLAMVILGSFVSRLSHGNYAGLITMATIEVSLATALLGSSNCFWKTKTMGTH